MVELGYALSSEEHEPLDLVRYAVRAEESGFDFALASDHFHPWLDVQGQSAFVWSVIGAIATSTQRLRLGTGVTCPIMRLHPAIVAQAAATSAAMMPGRFFLGLGTGERLNEHVVGDSWPPATMRREMLGEAIEVIRELWRGKLTSHRGAYFRVDNARLYTLPEEPPPIYVAASGRTAARLAGQMADGVVSTGPLPEVVEAFEKQGNQGPKYGQLAVCWAGSEDEAIETAYKWWPNSALKGAATQDLALPADFEAAVSLATKEQVAERIICGPNPERHIEGIRKYIDAGFDHVYLHQVGPDQEGFFRFYENEVLPRLRGAEAARAGVSSGSVNN